MGLPVFICCEKDSTAQNLTRLRICYLDKLTSPHHLLENLVPSSIRWLPYPPMGWISNASDNLQYHSTVSSGRTNGSCERFFCQEYGVH